MKLAFLLWLASVLPAPVADQVCLATTVYLEARSEPEAGQLAVAEVAMTRRDSGRWGDTACSVLLSPNQFALSTTHPGFVLRSPVALAKAWRVASRVTTMWALPHAERDLVGPYANSFYASSIDPPAWAKNKIATIGSHYFYRVN